MRILEKSKKYLPALDHVFLTLVGVYLIYVTATMTTFRFTFSETFKFVLFGLMCLVASTRILLLGFRNKKTWIGMAMAAVYLGVFLSAGYAFFLFIAVITVGFIDIDYRKILKMYLLTVGTFFAITVIAALSGSIENLIYANNGQLRSSWGMTYPTDLAALALYLLLFFWIFKKELSNLTALGLGAGSLFLSWYIANSRTGIICSVLFLAVIVYHALEFRVFCKEGQLNVLQRINDRLFIGVFALFAALMIGLVIAYGNGNAFAIQLDDLLTHRLRNANDAWVQYGLKPFGSSFELVGFGGTLVMPENYNFIDISYLLILLRYGYLPLIMITALWGWIIRSAIKSGDRRLVLAMVLIAFHAVSEHHLVEMNYNILLVMPLASYELTSEEQIRRTGKKERIAFAVVTAGGCALLCVVPWMISCMKTIFQMKGLSGEGRNGVIVITLIFIVLTGWCLLLWTVYRGILAGLNHARISKGFATAVAVSIVVSVGSVGYMHYVIQRDGSKFLDDIEANREILALITSLDAGKVYVDDFPELYQKHMSGISRSIFSGPDLCRFEDVSVLMKEGEEYKIFFRNDFRYVPASDGNALYTNSERVYTALTDAGYVS